MKSEWKKVYGALRAWGSEMRGKRKITKKHDRILRDAWATPLHKSAQDALSERDLCEFCPTHAKACEESRLWFDCPWCGASWGYNYDFVGRKSWTLVRRSD